VTVAGMTDLLDHLLARHGGLDRWRAVRALTARITFGGPFWAARGCDWLEPELIVRVETRREHITFAPFTMPSRTLAYDVNPADGAERIELLVDGEAIEARQDPRATFPPYDPRVHWDALQVGYFLSTATWNYLTEPWLFAEPDVETTELEPWTEGGETWRRLAVRFPERLPNHNRDQVFYVDEQFLLRRMDYHPDVTDSPIAHYLHDPVERDGLVSYARRRVHGRRPDGTADTSVAFITIDTSSVAAELEPSQEALHQ
jgi:hypothetical protein